MSYSSKEVKPPVTGAYEFIERHIRKVSSIAVRQNGSVSLTTFGGKVLEYKTIAEADVKLREQGL